MALGINLSLGQEPLEPLKNNAACLPLYCKIILIYMEAQTQSQGAVRHATSPAIQATPYEGKGEPLGGHIW